MSTATVAVWSRGILRHSRWDALLIALAVGHGAVLLTVPTAPVIALGVWWNSNTISHYFLHKPFFRSRGLNTFFSLYLSVLLGIPQTLWRDRHLAHHAGVPWKGRLSSQAAGEAALVLALWGVLAALAPWFFLTAYVPGYLAGLGLCWLHGYYEHARGTISHHGTIYNLLFFNDGYHVEHHVHPGEHWTQLPRRAGADVPTSRWPAVLRWLDGLSLGTPKRQAGCHAFAADQVMEAHARSEEPRKHATHLATLPAARTLELLEHWVLRSQFLQRWVLCCHRRAFGKLLPHLKAVRRVGVVGGGLFPRTLLILQRLLPGMHLVVIDRSAENIQTARDLFRGDVDYVHDSYDPGQVKGLDLVVFPLSFRGDRMAIYRDPPAPLVVVHDWIWRRRGTSVLVSVFLLKRLNLVQR